MQPSPEVRPKLLLFVKRAEKLKVVKQASISSTTFLAEPTLSLKMFGTQHTYVNLWVVPGGEMFRTKAHNDKTTTRVTWNESFTLDIVEDINFNTHHLMIEVKNRNTTGTKTIGVTKIPISCFGNKPRDQWYSLYDHRGQPAGEINVEGSVIGSLSDDKTRQELGESRQRAQLDSEVFNGGASVSSTGGSLFSHKKVRFQLPEVRSHSAEIQHNPKPMVDVPNSAEKQHNPEPVVLGVPRPPLFAPPASHQFRGMYPVYNGVMPGMYRPLHPVPGSLGMFPPMYGYSINPFMGSYYPLHPMVGAHYPMDPMMTAYIPSMELNAPGFVAPPGTQNLLHQLQEVWKHNKSRKH